MSADPGLALPATVHAIAPLSGPSDTLAYAGPARPRAFVLATAGCSLRGTETRGIDVVEQAGRRLLGGLGVAGATCGNVLLAPAQARRELILPAGTLIESLLVSPAGLVAQWTRAASPGQETQVELRVPGTTARGQGPFLRVDGPDGVRLIQLTPAPPTWRVDEHADRNGVLRAVVDLHPDQSGTRLAAVWGADRAAAEVALRRLGLTREARAEGGVVELRTRRLATRTGVDELDDGLAWATARLEATLGEGAIVHELAAGQPFPFDPDSRRAWVALAAQIAGTPGRLEIDPTTPLGALARARTATLLGRRLAASELTSLLDPAGDAAGDGARRAARRAALLEAADALEPWVGRASADDLRTRAATLAAASSAPATGPGIRLPTLGASARAHDPLAAALAAALDLPDRGSYEPPDDDPSPGALRALTAWACLNDGHLERGFALLRRHLADGFAQGAGLWPDGERVHDPVAAALVPLAFAHGLLGVRADAHYGRLRLSPRLPPHWSRLTVTGIGIGDATVRMEYEVSQGEHRFRFTQESGAVPVMLVLEPLLAIGSDTSARVDGEAAVLDVRPPHPRSGGRTQIKIQLPLDRERELSVG